MNYVKNVRKSYLKGKKRAYFMNKKIKKGL